MFISFFNWLHLKTSVNNSLSTNLFNFCNTVNFFSIFLSKIQISTYFFIASLINFLSIVLNFCLNQCSKAHQHGTAVPVLQADWPQQHRYFHLYCDPFSDTRPASWRHYKGLLLRLPQVGDLLHTSQWQSTRRVPDTPRHFTFRHMLCRLFTQSSKPRAL